MSVDSFFNDPPETFEGGVTSFNHPNTGAAMQLEISAPNEEGVSDIIVSGQVTFGTASSMGNFLKDLSTRWLAAFNASQNL